MCKGSRDTKYSDIRPTDIKPTDVTPMDVKPTDCRPMDIKPTDVTAMDIKATDCRPTGYGHQTHGRQTYGLEIAKAGFRLFQPLALFPITNYDHLRLFETLREPEIISELWAHLSIPFYCVGGPLQ